MRYLCNYITNSINQILLRNKLQTQQLSNLFKQIKTIPLIEIYNYFLSITPLEKSMIKSISHSNLHNLSNPKISIPYLKYISNKKYTLILDLDETLIHFIPQEIGNKGIIQYRPGLYQFLDNLFPYFELILWTGATQQYADPIINNIEKYKKYFACRLFREYSIFTDGIYIKNLENLGRDLSKVIIIDDKSCSFSAQKENGILIKPYFGDEKQNDYELIELIPILLGIIKDRSGDVRIGIKKYKYEILTKISKKIKNSNQTSNIFIEVNH
jgi:Dullard-like phosphatase family protein